LAVQAPFDLGHEAFRKPQGIESLLEGLGSVLRLATVSREALLRCAAATLSGVRVVFAHRLARDIVCFRGPCGVFMVAVCPSARDTRPLASVRTASPLWHVLPGLPAFFDRPCAVYIRPHGLQFPHRLLRAASASGGWAMTSEEILRMFVATTNAGDQVNK